MTVATAAYLAAAPSLYSIPSNSDHPSWDGDSRYYDLMFRIRSGLGLEGPASPGIVHVDIDDATLEEMRTRWPIPRVDQARGFKMLERLGVEHVIIDIEYLDQADWEINNDALLDFEYVIEEGFDELAEQVEASESKGHRVQEVKQLKRDMASLYAQFAKDPDAELTKTLSDVGATIALHSEPEETRKLSPKIEGTFNLNPLWIEKETLVGVAYLKATADRRAWISGITNKMNLEQPFAGKSGAIDELLRRWPMLDSDDGYSLLEVWGPIYEAARAIHIAGKFNSVAAPVPTKKILFPAHPSLMNRWPQGEVGFGFVDANSEPDGFVRRVPIFKDIGNRRYFQMAFRGHLAARGIGLSDIAFEDDALVFGEQRLPLENGRWFRVNWFDRRLDRQRTTVSFKDLWKMFDLELTVQANYEMALDTQLGPTEVAFAVNKGHFDLPIDELRPIIQKRYDQCDETDEDELNAKRFFFSALSEADEWIEIRDQIKPLIEGRLAFVGMAATSSTDRRPTPLDPDLDMVDLHATIADNILQGQFVQIVPAGIQSIAGLILIAVLSLMMNRFGFVGGLSTWLGAIALIGLVGFGLFLSQGFLIRGLSMTVAVSLLFLGVSGTKQLIEVYQKSFFKNTLGQFLSPNVAEHIAKNPEALIEMNQGKRQRMTVLFADIRGFTPFCEPLSPTEVQVAVNRIMNALTPAVFEFDGTHDKYMGDCIMAFFGAPMEYPDHALQACRCALKMRRILDDLVAEFIKEGKKPIDMGIGVSTGEMTVGNFGSTKTSDYSVLGDTVNLGARVEGLTRPLEADILITDETFKDVKDFIKYRDRGTHPVKGKSEPVQIWELLGFNADGDGEPDFSDEDLVARLRDN